jgi:hypothetical protein
MGNAVRTNSSKTLSRFLMLDELKTSAQQDHFSANSRWIKKARPTTHKNDQGLP